MALKAFVLLLACFIIIESKAVPVRCPKKCGKVRKLVNNVIECGCGALEPYGILADIPKYGCGKVCLDAAMDICGCKIPSIDTQLVGILDYLTGVVENKCGCQVSPCTCQLSPCTCQVTSCGSQISPCGCQVTPCGCQVTPCGCQVSPCGCQKAVTIANNYDVLSAIDIPRCAPVVQMAYAAPALEPCGKCSQYDCNCRNIPYEVVTVNGCVGPIMDVPAYVYGVPPVVEVLPLECGCGLATCGCGVGTCGCGVGTCTCGLPKVESCNCVTKYACMDCGGPCVCGTGSCGCGVPNCGCVNVCGCGIPECSCVNPCTCGVTGYNCGVTNCGCVGPCGCDANAGCCCRKRLRKTSIPPPFL